MINTITLKTQTLSYYGDASMLLCPMTAYLCSHRVPEGMQVVVRQWVEGLDAANTCVVCGNLTANERFACRLLIERGIPVVLALSRVVPDNLADLRLTPEMQNALQRGMMVIVSPVLDGTEKDTTAQTAAARNRLMISIAENIVVGFMAENGNLARQLLGLKNVTVLKTDGQPAPREDEAQRRQHEATQMGWAIYKKLKGSRPQDIEMDKLPGSEESMPWETPIAPVTSLEMRRLLAQYLKIEGIEKPSLLHSLILFQVMKYYAKFSDFNFTSFFRMWGIHNLRPEDWRSTKVNDKWLPSLTERVMARLMKAMPSKFQSPINPEEQFDTQLMHQMLDEAMNRSSKPNKRLLQRALSLAYFEHDSQAIEKYRKLLGKDAPKR